MNIVVYHLGELVAVVGSGLVCMILVWGFYWILRSKLNPYKITQKNLTYAMMMAYRDVFDGTDLFSITWDHPRQACLHDALLDGKFDPQSFQFNCMIVCDWIDRYNDWESGTTYNMWMTNLVQRIQV